MYSIFKTFVLSALIIAQVHFAYAQNAAILPPAMTTFLDRNGKPLTSGTVDFYIPSTSTRKATWKDADATVLNTNPVVLDAAGRALILGNGSYRQVVKDRNNNIQWDKNTSSAGAGGSGSITVGDGLAVGSVLPWSGFVAPANYAFSYGQELDRTTYSQLLSAITLTQNITCISGNATLTNVSDTTQINVGAAVEAACITAGSTVISKTSTTVTISSNATVSVTTTSTFFPWGNGNGLTTFNAPDLRGVVLPGRNNMGGSSSANLTVSFYTDPNSLAGNGGSQSKTLISSSLPNVSSSGANSISVTTTDTQIPNATTALVSSNAAGGAFGQFGNTTTTLAARTSTNAAQAIAVSANTGGIAVSATVAAGGSGYTAGTQLLTVSGGTCTTQPQFNVTIVAGAITDPVLVTAGQCSVVPTNPASTTGGGGTAGTLNIIYSAVPFSIIQPSKTINYIVKIAPDVNLSIARCSNLIDAGTACTANIGTSGNTVPLLNTANTFSAEQTFSAGIVVSGGATSITDLNAPVNPTDAATKAYVDSVATGLNILAQSALATAAVLPNTPTYSNGALGVGATLTAGSNTTLTVDGTAAPLSTVVLVKDQASSFQNGIYTVTDAGSGAAPWVLTRATYFDEAAEMTAGSYTLITSGSTNIGTSWVLQATVTTVGTDPLVWLQFAAQAGVVSVGGNQGIVTATQVTASCNIFTGALSGCVPSGSGTTVISQLVPTTQTWTTPTSLVVQTRTAAAALDLTNVNAIKTLGYASATDGGGATFYRKAAGEFLDQNVASGTISNNGTSGCTNGTYRGTIFSGGVGTGFMANVTVTANVVSAITKTFNAGGYGYAVGDVLSATITGCSTTVTFTVATVTTVRASFTDAGGNKWQYVSDNFIDPRQFGAVFDWLGVDGSATNDFAAIQAALDYAAYLPSINGFTTNGGPMASTAVLLPKGVAMVCSALTIYGGTQLRGQGPVNSQLHMCDAGIGGGSNFVTLCDPNSQIACFGAQIADVGLSATITPTGNAGTYMLYTNAAQQLRAISNVAIYGGQRGCFRYDTGYGGAALFTSHNLFCTMFSTANSDGIVLNAGTTLLKFYDTVSEGTYAGNAVNMIGGQITLDGFHTEAITTGININMTTATHSATVMHATGGNGCTNLVQLQATNSIGNFAIYDAVKNGCSTNLVLNGQPAGASRAADARPSAGWVSFNP
jgi:hypothetical protein